MFLNLTQFSGTLRSLNLTEVLPSVIPPKCYNGTYYAGSGQLPTNVLFSIIPWLEPEMPKDQKQIQGDHFLVSHWSLTYLPFLGRQPSLQCCLLGCIFWDYFVTRSKLLHTRTNIVNLLCLTK